MNGQNEQKNPNNMGLGLMSALGVGASLFGVGNSLALQGQQQANFDEQMRFQKYMYEDSKRYNSMKNQVARMRSAGINPALALGAGQLGSVVSPSGQPSAPSFDGLGIGDTLSGIASVESAESQKEVYAEDAKRIKIDNMTRLYKNSVDIMESIAKLRKLGIDTQNAEEMLKQNMFNTAHQQEQFDASIKKMTAESNYLDSQSYNNQILSAKLGFEVEHQEEEFTKRMNLLDQQAFNAYWTAIAANKSAEAARTSAAAVYYDAHKILGIPEGKIDSDNWTSIVVGKLDALAAQGYIQESESSSNDTGFNVGSDLFGRVGANNKHSSSKTSQRKVYGTKPGKKRY